MRLITKWFFTFALLCMAGVANAAVSYEVDQKFTSIEALDGQAFAIVAQGDTMAVYGSGAQNLDFGTITTAVTKSGNSGYYFKLEASTVEGAYLLRLQTPAGEPYNIWGSPGYLNSGAEGGFDGCFILGLNNQNGQDVENGAVWEIEYAEGQGFALKNKARGGYFAGVNPAPTAAEPIYWAFCTLKEGAEIPDPEPVVIPEPEAPLGEGELIPDFFSICDEGGLPYGYEVKFGSEDRAYPTTYTGGARMFAFAEGGDFTRGLYFREGYVQYGNVKKLALEANKKYIVHFNSAMWKDSGATLDFYIFKEGDLENAVLTQTINNTPDVNGSKDAVTGSTSSAIEFVPETDGNYILKWDASGWKEVLLANVGVKIDSSSEEPVFTPAYGVIWDSETGETATEDGNTVITLSNAFFKDFAKAEDTIRVSIANVAQARAARIVKKGELTIKTSDGEILLENKDVKADETAIDIVLNEDVLAKIAAAENVLFIYKNMTVTKIELLEKPTDEPQPQPTGIAEGKYYIYNVGVNKYLAAGANWGTHAIVNERGLDYGLALADGKYTIDSQVSNGGANNYLNGEWNDGAAFGWEFNEVAEGIYTISNGENFLTAGENGLVTLAGDATVAAAQWTLVTVADRDSINLKTLEAATAENGVDATFFIKGADFNRNDLRNKAWTATKSGGNQTIGGPSADRLTYGCESWNNTFDVNQTLENLPDGVYEFSIAGYGTNGTTYIYANETEAAFVNTESAANFGDAVDRIANGEFAGNTTGKVNVVGGTLKIGVKRTSQVGADWAVFDKAQLTYYGAISTDAYKTAYEDALAAAQAALADAPYAAVTGEEKTNLEQAIADYTTVENTQDAYVTATVALTTATNAFKAAKASYEALTAAKDNLTAKQYAYAAAAKKTAAEQAAEVTATSAADAQAKLAALYQAFRQYAESHALAEGVETAVNMTDVIVNPTAEEAIAEPWALVKGEGSGGSLTILDGEPWTDGEGNSAHKYFDGGDWGATSWDVALQQEITLPAGKYLLTAKGRASADVTLTLFAGANIVEMPAVGASGALFDRGWDDTSVEFELADEGPVAIGVRGVTTAQYNWMSFSNFRLVKLSATSDGISTVNAAKQQSGVVYNLQGQQVEKAQKGLYIMNGKKVVVK